MSETDSSDKSAETTNHAVPADCVLCPFTGSSHDAYENHMNTEHSGVRQ